jgi:hypothetical protein
MKHPRVYIAYPDERLPNGIVYPIKPMIEKYGNDFWASSLSYMFALAMEQKPVEIGMWGVDMSAGEEYGWQRPACKFFTYLARMQGIKVTASALSDILTPAPMYGYKEFSPMYQKQKVRRRELEERIAKCNQKISQAEHERDVVRGAIDDMNYIDGTYCPTLFDPAFDDV